MDFLPSAKELSHFPFLKKAQDPIKSRFSSLDTLLTDPRSETLIGNAVARIQNAISLKKGAIPRVSDVPEDEIAGYAFARIIVSCVNDRQLIDRLTRYEAERAYYFLRTEGGDEDSWNKNFKEAEFGYSRLFMYISHELGMPVAENRIPLADYVELVAAIHEERFRLVNRQVHAGEIVINNDEMYELLRERIRVLLRRDLPHKVPASVCGMLAPRVDQLKKAYQEQMLQQFGTIEEHAFPPCMQVLITALTAGTNLTHAGRFALTTFLHTVGMDAVAIGQLYARSPDFDPEKTMYQVEHITGRGGSGTEYTAPACAAMRTTGLCTHRDPLCERIGHPLSYYKIKKNAKFKTGLKKEKGPDPKPN
jgi:DNA primase large subunit